MVGYPRFNRIISSSRRIFAYLHTLSIWNSSCDTNKWLIVDFVDKGMIFSSKCIVKHFAVRLCPNPLGSLQCSPNPLAGFAGWAPEGKEERGGQEGIPQITATSHVMKFKRSLKTVPCDTSFEVRRIEICLLTYLLTYLMKYGGIINPATTITVLFSLAAFAQSF